jgi:two-component system LytT family response regulator
MRRIRTLIVDDEPLSREGIALMLENDPEIEVIGQCADGQDAVEQMLTQQPDLAFLDVHMPRLNGLEVLERLPPERRPVVVFITAHDRYAIRAFELCATEYLLKPFHDERFQTAMRRAKEQVARADFGALQRQTAELMAYLRDPGRATAPAAPERPAARRRLAFKVGGTYEIVEADEIVWIEAQGNLVKLCAGGRTHLIREPLEQIGQRLDAARFVRVHRSFLVNADRVRKVVPLLYGDHTIVMSDGAKIRLSRSYRHQLKALLPPDSP